MMRNKDLNENPYYYELTYSFRDAAREWHFLEQCMRLFSERAVRRVLELSSGPSAYLRAIAGRRCRYVGVDSNETMLAYARQKAQRLGGQAEFVHADLRDFSIEGGVDFAFTSFSSMRPESFEDALVHMENLARPLEVGGLYCMDWCVTFHWKEPPPPELTWTIEAAGKRLDAHLAAEKALQQASHLFRRNLTVEVSEGGKKTPFAGSDCLRVFLPEEFLHLLEMTGTYEFVGWWNRSYLAGETVVVRPISLVRRVPDRKPRRKINLLAEEVKELWRG